MKDKCKARVRNGKLLEGLDENFDPGLAGEHLSPQQWNQMLDQVQDRVFKSFKKYKAKY